MHTASVSNLARYFLHTGYFRVQSSEILICSKSNWEFCHSNTRKDMSYCTIEEAWGTGRATPPPSPRRKKRRPAARAAGGDAGRAGRRSGSGGSGGSGGGQHIEHYALHDHNQADQPDLNSSAYAYTEPSSRQTPDAGEPDIDSYRQNDRATFAEADRGNAGPSPLVGERSFDDGMRMFSRDVDALPNHVSAGERTAEQTVEIDAAPPLGTTTYAPSGMEDGMEDERSAPLPASPARAPASTPDDLGKEDWMRNDLSYLTEQVGQLNTKVDRLSGGSGGEGGGASPMADTVLFVFTGVISIFLLDLFLRAGQRIAVARTR